MRSRHQAITISSKTKKNILKELFIDHHSNPNEQNEYLTEFFLSKFPKNQINEEKKGPSTTCINIPPPKVRHKKLISTCPKFFVSERGNFVNFDKNDYIKTPSENSNLKLNINDLKAQINKEDNVNDLIIDDFLNINLSKMKYLKEKLGYFNKKITNSKNKPNNYSTLKKFFEKVQKEEEKLEEDVGKIIYNLNNIDNIEFLKEGNVINFKK